MIDWEVRLKLQIIQKLAKNNSSISQSKQKQSICWFCYPKLDSIKQDLKKSKIYLKYMKNVYVSNLVIFLRLLKFSTAFKTVTYPWKKIKRSKRERSLGLKIEVNISFKYHVILTCKKPS